MPATLAALAAAAGAMGALETGAGAGTGAGAAGTWGCGPARRGGFSHALLGGGGAIGTDPTPAVNR